jgi:hypothetical protein
VHNGEVLALLKCPSGRIHFRYLTTWRNFQTWLSKAADYTLTDVVDDSRNLIAIAEATELVGRLV